MKSKKIEKKVSSADKSAKDHRELGVELDLFSFHEIAPGAPFWHGKGMIIWRELEKYIRKLTDREDYQETSTPVLVKTELFKKSGHWDHYSENMFWFKNPRDEKEILALKPMNCPESTLIYSSRTRSYRDLPIRLAEVTDRLHRNELSGTLGGLMRVRQFTQDDAHIYCRTDQIEGEITKLMDIVKEFYANFDMLLSFNLATRPDKAMGDPKLWEEAEKNLENVLKKTKVKYAVKEKDGAFYGPKIDINVTDSQNREWTIATIQLDFQIPERMGLEYVDEGGKKKRPVMIHRAILGTFERFIGIILEHYQGALPFWLSPVQVSVLSINDKVLKYSEDILNRLRTDGIRAEIDLRNETISKKIREAEMQKIPYLLIIGEKEVETKKVAVRERGKGDIGQKTIEEFLKIAK
ncbi:threonine--tRNA ligase [Candidatus Giovannonibacteria bacterium RIFCSPLOWO2_02_FULL_43_11b]|uniref:Threonine--tRNA ligase n=1 Tax=Candidatus Giovannonibacteria bacterium RIFCSPHIGHO2_12_FULL_43_15 TaxID=1798341 RepID=A0A1F5WPW7_9BACT|nr:MAG: threonine--tRNA ligase [Candidatus Giovannonibacteria bacterium RIFCSPHIGHO2_01_FULL_43_100]OGF66364.1 MAG: threonine--tRNA ligase [Candidatus Giovannonibacteria bacterium RIFCSPHIGHO2_02_FULL_43_32]OGF77723.1 MAG: threonine--tRNA ligase [Candidatus Giovannonibacteria bacterium RIFCSPHIGHO2_12_FULL_43_15]OGF78064.1 MAG: threonine--tRNA ligase [Candidatus Giovannonibacteria bacterium RIFCSPLOWO2_01_FULL_43_60]OGF89329.1 MAG: threonine--tRNA ligase [Candidatus Giovannonibacteria bacterium